MNPKLHLIICFRSNIDFTLVFKDDKIIVLYKNKKVDITHLHILNAANFIINKTTLKIYY